MTNVVQEFVAKGRVGHSKPWETGKFAAKDNFPELSKNNTYMASNLTPELYAKYWDKVTPLGVTFDKCIQTGVDNPGNKFYGKKTGCIFGDEHSYELYKDFFDAVINEIHNFGPADVHPPKDLEADKLVGGEFDDKYVKSCRIRSGRSVRGLCLPPAMSRAERRLVEKIVSDALTGLDGDLAGKYYPLLTMSKEDQTQLIEDHFMFEEPTGMLLTTSGCARDWPDGRGIYHNAEKNFLVWVNEEDHVRVISMQKGGNMKAVFSRFARGVVNVEELMKKKGYEFMRSDRIGYVCTCPSNLGTVVRCSVHIQLKNLEKDDRMDAILKGYGLSKRGTGGESSLATDSVYDVSNIARLGRSERQLIQDVIDGITKLIEIEQALGDGKPIDDLLPKPNHNAEKNFLVWVNEEDHVRVISMQKGGNMKAVFSRFARGVVNVEELMKKKGYEFMRSDRIGYVCTCPSNLGTVVRCSVHIQLKNLEKDDRMDAILKGYGLSKRGTGGESSLATDSVYDVSNIARLGRSERQLIQDVIDGITKLIEIEQALGDGKPIDDLLPKPK